MRRTLGGTCSRRRRSKDKLLESDDTPDPRFLAKADDLKKQGVKDFQLYYALNTLKRLARPAPTNIASERRHTQEVALG